MTFTLTDTNGHALSNPVDLLCEKSPTDRVAVITEFPAVIIRVDVWNTFVGGQAITPCWANSRAFLPRPGART